MRRSFFGQAGDVQALRDCIAAYLAAGLGQFEVEVPEWPFGYAQDKASGSVLIRAPEVLEAEQHGQSFESPAYAYPAGVLAGFSASFCSTDL